MHDFTPRRVLLALVAACSLVGCGGGSDSNVGPSTAPPTDFAAEASDFDCILDWNEVRHFRNERIRQSSAVALACVSPVMFRNKTRLRIGKRNGRFGGARRFHAQSTPPSSAFPAALPPVFDRLGSTSICGDGAEHWHGDVWFVVGRTPNRRNRPARHQFAEERDTVPDLPGAIRSHVKSKVHLIKIAMERNADSQDSRVEEPESDHADQCFAVPQIQFCAGRDIWMKNRWIHAVTDHRQMTPLRGEKHLA